MNTKFFSIVLAFFLVGCASKSPVPQAATAAVSTNGQTKLVITRNNDLQYMALSARLDVNGARVAELKRGESYVAVLNPGVVNLATDGWGWSGNYKASFNLEADQEYLFELGPREGSLAVAIAFGGLGSEINAAVGENTGPFSMKLKGTKLLRYPALPRNAHANTAPALAPAVPAVAPRPSVVSAPVPVVQSPASPSDEAAQLQKLKELRDKNLITADEYETKRKVILDKL